MLQSVVIITTLVCLLCNFLSSPVYAEGSESSKRLGRIEQLTYRIIAAEDELERFYLKYQLEGNKVPRWRRARYFALQQTAASQAAATNIAILDERASNIKTPRALSRDTFRKALTNAIIGSAIGGSSSGIELCSNGLMALKNKRNGKDPASALEFVVTKLSVLDELLRERKDLVAQMPAGRLSEMLATEGRLLALARDINVYEFSDTYCDIRSNQTSNNVFYALNLATNAVSMTASILFKKGLRNPRFTGQGLTNAIVASSLSISSGPARKLSRKLLRKFWLSRLKRKLGEEIGDPQERAKKEIELLKSQVAAADPSLVSPMKPLVARLTAYSSYDFGYQYYIDTTRERIRRRRKISLQSAYAGPLLSMASLASGVLNGVGFWRYRRNPSVRNKLGVAAAICGTNGSMSSVALTSWWALSEARLLRKLKKEGATPEQLIKRRLKTLDESVLPEP